MPTLALNIDPTGMERGGDRAERALRDVKHEARNAQGQFVSMGNTADREMTRTGRASSRAAGKVNLLAAAATAAASAFAGRSTGAYREYNQALSEVSTLIEGTDAQLEYLDTSAKDLAATFGGTATQQVSAFYQAISAGAGSVQEANELLLSANKLAVGGVTDIMTSVDGLTTVMNAYRQSGLGASEASDILFTGVRLGKTTIAELSSALGQVVPTSAAVDVGLDEIVGSIAALTATGQSTAQSVTGIRQALVSVIKPTKEAQDVAKALGIEFSTSALQTKGLAGFLADVTEKTGGSQDAMAKLFGSVEALNAVLALTSDGGVAFEQVLFGMDQAAGAADEAFNKVSGSLSQRLSRQFGILNGKALELGEVILSMIVPALEYLTADFDRLGEHMMIAGGLISVFFPWIGILTAAAGLVLKLGENWDYVKAAGQVALEYLTDATGITMTDIEGYFIGFMRVASKVWEIMVSVTKKSLNFMIGSAKAGYDIFVELFPQIPIVVGDAIKSSVNWVIGGIEKMINGAIRGVNTLVDGLNAVGQFIGLEGNLAGFTEVALGRFEEDLSGSIRDVGATMDKALANVGVDHLENFFAEFQSRVDEQVKQNATKITVIPESGQGTGTGVPPVDQTLTTPPGLSQILSGSGSGGGSRAKDAVNQLRDAYRDLRSSLDPVYARTLEFREAQNTLKSALDAGLISNQEYADTLRLLKAEYEDLNETSVKGADRAAQFFTSIVRGAKSASEAVSDLAGRMADKLLNQGFEMLLSFLFPSGGGFFDFLFNARGNAFDAGAPVAFANGGVVNRATPFGMSNGRMGVMGEAGPEAILPLSRGSDGKLGVVSQNRGGRTNPISVEVHYNIDARGTNNEAVENLRRQQESDRARLRSDVIQVIRDAQQDRIL